MPLASLVWVAGLAALGGCATEPARETPPPLPAATAKDIVLTAMGFLDTPYRRGGTTETGFDCSGFTRHVVERSTGLMLPRTAWEQAASNSLHAVPLAAAQPADLVFFNTLSRPFSHVGILVGEGRFIHAPRPGTAVRLEEMRLPYWSQRFNGARRLRAAA